MQYLWPSVLIVALTGCGADPVPRVVESVTPDSPAASDAATRTVTVTVRAVDGKGVALTEAVPFVEDATVLDAMRSVESDALGMRLSGDGETAFIEALLGVDGEGGSGRNWLYWVNGDFASAGIGSQVLEPGDEVEWRFATMDAMKASE